MAAPCCCSKDLYLLEGYKLAGCQELSPAEGLAPTRYNSLKTEDTKRHELAVEGLATGPKGIQGAFVGAIPCTGSKTSLHYRYERGPDRLPRT